MKDWPIPPKVPVPEGSFRCAYCATVEPLTVLEAALRAQFAADYPGRDYATEAKLVCDRCYAAAHPAVAPEHHNG